MKTSQIGTIEYGIEIFISFEFWIPKGFSIFKEKLWNLEKKEPFSINVSEIEFTFEKILYNFSLLCFFPNL